VPKSLKYCLALWMALQPCLASARFASSAATDWLCDSSPCRSCGSQGCADGWGGCADGCAGSTWGNASPDAAAVIAGAVILVVVVYGAYAVVCKNCEMPKMPPPAKPYTYVPHYESDWDSKANHDLLPSRP
jgi:hypothetical protein